MTKQFSIYGAIDSVVRGACTPSDLIEVPLGGFGVGAGAFGSNVSDALEVVGDATFLFGSAFVSQLPGAPQRVRTAASLAAGGVRYFAPIMARFSGGTPDLHLGELPTMSQQTLLENHVLRALPDTAAVGCVALVHIHSTDVAGALIAAPIAADKTHVPVGKRTTDPDLRPEFFDLDPMRHVPTFEEGSGWLVSTCLRRTSPNSVAPDRVRRFGGDGRHDGHLWLKHSHIVLTRQVPASWVRTNGSWSWETAYRDASSAIDSSAAGSFAFHSDDTTVIQPISTIAWGYDEQAIRIHPTAGQTV